MNFTPLSGREFPRFSAIKTFFRLPQVDLKENFDVALFGVPFDGGTSYRPGSRLAPSSVREISSIGRAYHWSRGIDVFQKLKVADVGDCPTVPIDLAQTYARIEQFVGQVLAGKKKFIAVGGDHSITLPILRALKRQLGPVQLLHFDAHLDTYPAAWGCEYHHGSFLRHAVEEGLLLPGKIWQIGLRGPLAAGADLDFANQKGLHCSTIDDLRRPGLEVYLKGLPDFGTAPTYVTFDVDCLDPAFAPGTGTPVVGGLSTYEVQRILRALKINQLVGADIVEVSPPFDHGQITSLAAVDTMFELLCLMTGR